MQQDRDKGNLVSSRVLASHKLPGAACSHLCNQSLHQIPVQCSCPNTNGQYISNSVSKQNGGSQTVCARQTCSYPLGMVSQQENLSSSRAHSGSTECHSRCRVSGKARCSRLEARFRSVQCSESEFRSSYNRPFCQQEQCSAGEILQLSARSSSRTVQCSSSALKGGESLRLSPFQLISKCLKKISLEGTTLLLVCPVWPAQAWYPHLLQLLTSNPVLLPIHSDLLLDPLGNRHPLIVNNSLPLAGWRVSGNTSLQRAYQKLQIFSSLPNADQQMLSTSPVGLSGVAGVANDRLIPFDQL